MINRHQCLLPFHPMIIKKCTLSCAGNAASAWLISADHLLAGARELIRELQPLAMSLPINSEVPEELCRNDRVSKGI
jgi:hypothetical protein